MSKLAPQSEILKLTPSSKTQADKGNFKGAQGVEENESFLNALLASIEETNAFLPQNMKISKEEVAFEVMDKLKFSSFDEQDKISIFESASFMQILSLLDKLKIDTAEVKFSKLSSQLSELVKSEANFNALRGAKNIDELLQVAKNLGLEVRDIKVDRLLDLKATFPNLDRADFFKGAVDDVFKKVIENKIAHIEKELDKNLQGQNLSANLAGSQKNETPSLLSQTLQNLDSLTPKNPHKKEAKEERPKEPTPIRENLKENFKERQEGKNPSAAPNAAPNAAPKTIQEGRAQEASPVPKNAQSTFTQSTFTQSVQTQEATQNFKETKEERPKEPTPIRENLKENFKERQEGKNPSAAPNAAPNAAPKTIQEGRAQEASPVPKNAQSTFTQSTFTQSVQTQEATQNFGQKQENSHKEGGAEDLNALVKDLHKIHQNQGKNISAKETLQYFSQDLKEAVEQYKAPISRLSITLNPSNLGEVEVTLIQRGSNLHINFNSNTNAMQIFLQNQAEFKNSLVNMGFTGLEMNFSDQNRKEQQQEKRRSGSGGLRERLENKDEEKMSLELVLARYF